MKKLVRDKVSELFPAEEGGRSYEVLAKNKDFRQALKEKLVEEAKELARARGREELLAEMADIQEVIMTILEKEQIKPAEVNEVRLKKLAERGGFTRGEVMIAPGEAEIGIEDFGAVEMRVGIVEKAEAPEWSDKLIKQTVNFGEESDLGVKTIFSGIRAWYTPEDLVGKRLVYVTNLAPRKMGEEMSEGMILAVTAEGEGGEGRPILWELPETVKVGERVG